MEREYDPFASCRVDVGRALVKRLSVRWRFRLQAVGISIVLIMPLAYAGDESLDLKTFLEQISNGNPAIQAARSRYSALENRIKPAATLEDPFIAAGIDEVPFGEHRAVEYRYQISQAFPFPGKLDAREQIARSKAEVADQDAETLRRELTVAATQYFYKAHYLEEALALNRELRRLVETSVESAKARYRSGEPEHHDWLLGKIELANLDVEYNRLASEQRSIHVLMNELRGIQPDAPVERIVARFESDAAVGAPADLEAQPELRALESQLNRAESESKLAKLGYYPDFVVQVMAMEPNNGGMNGGMEEEKGNWGVMVGVNLPLYAYRKQAKLAAAAEDEKHAVAMERQYLLNRLNTEIFNAQQQFMLARNVVRLYEREVMPVTELALANAKVAYTSQRIPLSQYVDVLKVYRTQKLELVAALTDIELAKTRVRELLSSPPLMKIAPNRPTLFGAGGMSDGGMSSPDPVSMGGGLTAPKNVKNTAGSTESGGSTGMGGM